MKHILTLTALVFATACFGQAPDYVPTDGLVAWWPFEVDGQDMSGIGNHLTGHNGVQFVGQQGAFGGIYLDGVDDYLSCIPFSGIGESSDHSLSFWTSGEIEFGNRWILTEYNAQANANKSLHCGIRTSYCSESSTGIASAVSDFYQNQALSPCFSETSWTHWVMTFKRGVDERRVYKNGALVHYQVSSPYESNLNDGVLVGGIQYDDWDSPDYSTSGFFDDVGVWNRSLMESEVAALYESLAMPGCMEEDACNYNPDALLSDGSCDLVSCHCLEGTVWDESLGGCMPLISAETACGEGTVWDAEAQHCVIANPSDTDFNGCVSMTDLLDLLSVFGTCNETPWTCGDPLEYQGHAYETVQIGEQCWFAENLRSENYLNGDAILSSLSGDEWSTVNVGAVSTFGEGESNCYNYSPNGDACNETWALSEYGRLYNWHATVDDRGLCPTDWHVSSDSDWLLLMEFLGGSFDAEMAMKTTTGWSNSGDGSNSSGFSGLPGGHRSNNLGNFNLSGTHGYWWSSSTEGMDAVGYYLSNLNEGLIRITVDPRYGSSIRCIQDSE